jgi:hypothetical protein
MTMDVDELLTTTRSRARHSTLTHRWSRARYGSALPSRRRPPTGPISRAGAGWSSRDAALRDKVVALYRDAYLERVGGNLIADLLPADTPGGRLMSSTEWLVENLA